MSIPELLDRYTEALGAAGVRQCFADHACFTPASDAELAALSEHLGCPLPPDLEVWLRSVERELPFLYNFSALRPARILKRLQGTATIDFSRHLENVRSWKDGRWADGRLQETYWSPRWVPVTQDGCGNEVCVDLAPGPRGRLGQLVQMEFQDGQGPYLARWPSLAAMLEAHLEVLSAGRFEVDEEGFVELLD